MNGGEAKIKVNTNELKKDLAAKQKKLLLCINLRVNFIHPTT